MEHLMAATTAKNHADNAMPTFELPSVEEASQSVRDLGERWKASSRNAGLVTLDAYEKVLNSVVDFEKKVASEAQVEWVSALATSHASLLSDLTGSYTAAARDLLK